MPFWRGLKEPCFYQEFYAGIVQALRELGHEALQFPYADVGKATIEEANALYRLLAGGNVAAVLDLACWSCGLSRLTIPFAAGGRRPIFDAFGIPYVGLLFDQPFNQGLNVIVAQALYAAYPDRGHPEQVRLVYPSLRLRGEIFAPLAGRLRSRILRRAGGYRARAAGAFVGRLRPGGDRRPRVAPLGLRLPSASTRRGVLPAVRVAP